MSWKMETCRYFTHVNAVLITESDERTGTKFFRHLMTDPEIRTLYKTQWKAYRNSKFNALMDFIEHYAATIRESQQRDFEIWESGEGDLAQSKAAIKTFLRNRVKHIDAEMANL